MTMPTALEIARQATLKPVTEIAEGIGIPPWLVEQHGDHVAKIDLRAIEELQDRPKAKYVVVTAITPTPLGEGKTTTTIGLGSAGPPRSRSARRAWARRSASRAGRRAAGTPRRFRSSCSTCI
jgi:formyltetrahydrofolate synthetase